MTLPFPAVNMALGQLATNEVRDKRIIDAMIAVPRNSCVPDSLKDAAYVDDELPLGNGRFLLSPLAFARMLMAADIQPQDKVLDVGCAYGYSTAVIAHLAKEAVGCECDRAMAEAARRNLDAFGIPNARVALADNLLAGYGADAPYNAIIVEGAVSSSPTALISLLADGGRLVSVFPLIAKHPGVIGRRGRIVTHVRRGEEIYVKYGVETTAAMLPGNSAASDVFTF